MSESTSRDLCVLCRRGRYDTATEVATVPSNVRRWREVTTTVWRCSGCGSLHNLERRDLTPFYEDYPYARRQLDGFTRRVFDAYIRRLSRHGVAPSGALLDYGCSQGLLLDHLRARGFVNCAGFDPYSSRYRDPTVLEQRYDTVICQDVIEHVEDPLALLRELAALLRPGGLLCVGTPRADGIELAHANEAIHSLHMPYHLHILSERALVDGATAAGLRHEHLYRQHSCDTRFPFTNWAFLRTYLRAADDTLDAGFDPPRIGAVATSPRLWALGLFGGWRQTPSEMIAMLRKPSH